MTFVRDPFFHVTSLEVSHDPHPLMNHISQKLNLKNARAGIPRAKAGVMRRVSMAILKANARHVLRGLEIIVPQAMHTHVARRARS